MHPTLGHETRAGNHTGCGNGVPSARKRPLVNRASRHISSGKVRSSQAHVRSRLCKRGWGGAAGRC